LSAWSLGKVGAREAKEAIQGLLGDAAPVIIYEGGELRRTTVGQVAQEALAQFK
jgi:hypothetical protein